jgi:DNA-directed RNA polymerase specialized sigma24 family protein
MTEGLLSSEVGRSPPAWLPVAAEAEAYEGIRRGEEAAFRLVAQALQPVLRRLTRVIVLSSVNPDDIVARAWWSSLRTLHMFRWRMPFASWVASATVTHARTHGVRQPALPSRVSPLAGVALAGPADWSDLPWGARWEDAQSLLAAPLMALQQSQREVVHARDVERWPSRRVCDVLGLVEVDYERLLAEGRARLRAAVASFVGESDNSSQWAAQLAAIIRLLRESVDDRDDVIDARTLESFNRWRAQRLVGWRRLRTLWS